MKKPLYMTAEERREVLREYGKKYDLNVFIETGTSVGDTPWELKDDFDVLYTIEVFKPVFRAAKERFKDEPKINPLFGDSTTVLPWLLPQIKEPALVWLDGHYCGPGSGHGDLDTPVVQELEIIFNDIQTSWLGHVILIDDARIFKGQPEHEDEPHYADYPSCEWVQERAEAILWDFELKDDIMRLTPRDE